MSSYPKEVSLLWVRVSIGLYLMQVYLTVHRVDEKILNFPKKEK